MNTTFNQGGTVMNNQNDKRGNNTTFNRGGNNIIRHGNHTTSTNYGGNYNYSTNGNRNDNRNS